MLSVSVSVLVSVLSSRDCDGCCDWVVSATFKSVFGGSEEAFQSNAGCSVDCLGPVGSVGSIGCGEEEVSDAIKPDGDKKMEQQADTPPIHDATGVDNKGVDVGTINGVWDK